MSLFLSERVHTHEERYDDVIKELMKVRCEGGSPEESHHRLEVIDRTPLNTLLPLDAWNDSLDVRCGCFEAARDVACGSVWRSNYVLAQ